MTYVIAHTIFPHQRAAFFPALSSSLLDERTLKSFIPANKQRSVKVKPPKLWLARMMQYFYLYSIDEE